MAGNVAGNRVGFSIDTSVDLGETFLTLMQTTPCRAIVSGHRMYRAWQTNGTLLCQICMVFAPMVRAGLSTVLQSNFDMGRPSAGTAVSSGIALQLHVRMGVR
jgi:hypothetical protein